MRKLLLAVMTVLSVACGDPNVAAPGEEVRSKKERLTTGAPAADVTQAVRDNATFGFDVFRKLEKPADGNVAFSPMSLNAALSLTMPGARNATQTAFERTMRLSMPQDRYHRAMNEIDRGLKSRGQTATNGARPFKLRSNNQVFAQKGFSVESDYLDLLATEYGAGVRLLDFKGATETSRKAINDWVSTNTVGLIPELLKEGVLTTTTRLTLVNTLYFNAAWKKAFDANKTSASPFARADGSTMQALVMTASGLEGARRGTLDGVDVVDLPYDGEEVSMLVLMPARGELAKLETALDGAKLEAFVGALKTDLDAVRLPKFEARTTGRLDEALKALGLEAAFDDQKADFSGINKDERLYIGAVVQEAVVKVDESGTEAAAASAVVLNGRSSISEPFTIDRAFIYVIRDRATGTPLFVGRVSSPTASSN